MLAVVYILSAVLFLLILISLGSKPKWIARTTTGALVFVAAAGILLYGYGYFSLLGPGFISVARTLFSVFCMFLGRNEIGAISAVPLLAKNGMQILIYLTHWLALYCTASAVVAAFGANVVRMLHLLLIHRGNLNLIYGVSADSVGFAEKLDKKDMTVFFDPEGKEDFGKRIAGIGGLLMDDEKAAVPTARMLRRLGIRPGRRHFTLYCFDENSDKNLSFAAAFRAAAEELGLAPEQLSLTAFLEQESAGESLQAGRQYGFGTVLAINRPELMARLMVQKYPPFRTIRFDEKGRALDDFEAVIVGFGTTGQAVLRSLVMNGQFEGSHFRATVLALDHENGAGSFFYRYPGIRNQYEIEFVNGNAHSVAAYRMLRERKKHINYVAVCTGDEKENSEILKEYSEFFAGTGVPVVRCSPDGVSVIGPDRLTKKESLYVPELLCTDRIDRMAMMLNHRYAGGTGRSAEENWAECDYFSRMSCRASTDFVDAFLWEANTTAEEVLAQTKDGGESWPQSEELLENMAKTEHLRWCAFHYAMGYEAMPEEVFEQKAEEFRREMAETGSSKVRLTKDTGLKYHACLTGWDELDALGAREAAVTGVYKDYKQLDRNNILEIPEMLREAAK